MYYGRKVKEPVITLKDVVRRYDLEDMINMYSNEEGISDIFENKVSRIFSSNVMRLIHDGSKNIGFLNLVDEHLDGFLFMDLGIIKSERGKGYSKKAIEYLLGKFHEDVHIIGEVKEDNVQSNKVSNDLGKLLFKINDRNIYLIGKDELNEEEVNNLKDHFDDSKLLIK